jgi:hypothetical protein
MATKEQVGGGTCGVIQSLIDSVNSVSVGQPIKKLPKRVWLVEMPPDRWWCAHFNDVEHGSGHGLVGFKTKKLSETMLFKASRDLTAQRVPTQVTFEEAREIAFEKEHEKLVFWESEDKFKVIDFLNG